MDCEETTHQPKKIRVRPNKKTPFRAREIQSPTERKLFHEVLRLRKHNQVLQKKQARWKKRRNLEKQCTPKQTIRMQKGLKKMNRVQEEFLNMMHANNSIKSKGRRYSSFDKILSLSIYKQSPKCYRYLQSFLPLPSKSTLSSVLSKMHIDTGITDETKQRLLEAAKLCTNDQEKVGILMWDEVSLGLGVHYDSSTDKVVGFEDWGTVRTEQYSDHALVFMLRLVKSGAKIPISFNFCSSMTKTAQLLRCIKETLAAVKEAGFHVAATVCDQCKTNESAINTLVADTIKVKGSEYVQARYGSRSSI
ncbi:uncharacterized protein LOC127285407 [Leptopilina boulardi]|uniref:uncharacterized protein LOC127285407 n=1 Tax=Leptopilina boulardi TaxID=63433 RepID=UPI0021F50497|nr:uncharacterized protein LOC127285407 [Leptopilina boulardi]